MDNYKGIFYNEDKQKHYYEGGAHFKYKHLVRALESIKAKRDEESENKRHSRNKSLDYNKENKVSNKNIITIDNNNNNNNSNNINIFDSPKKDGGKDAYIEQLLSYDTIKLPKKRRYKLKEIKSEHKQKPVCNLYTENNRYNDIEYNENRSNVRNNSLDHQYFNERNNKHQNKALSTEENNPHLILNLQKITNKHHKSQKNLDILPKIDSLYYNKYSLKNVIEYNSNSNMATNSTNNKSEFIDPNKKMEYEINKNLNLPDFHIFSHKKKLPQLNVQSMSPINNDKSNILFDKNRLKFTIDNNRNNKEDLISKQNNINSFNEYNNDEDDKDYIIRNISLKKNNYNILKLADEDKEKKNDLYSKLFSIKNRKKSHKKSLKKIAKIKEE